jgi:uncharacterized protein YegL
MKKGLSEIVILLDRSGSMNSIRKDMIGGINAFLQAQKKSALDCKVSHYQFDKNHGLSDILTVLYERRDISNVADITEDQFVPRGGTPLYDAVATVISKIGERLAASTEGKTKVVNGIPCR